VNGNNDNDIDLVDIFNLLWSKKLFIVLITLSISLISIFYALNLPNYYKSEALLSMRDAEQSQGLSAVSQYGGLAQMAGISIPKTGGENKSQYVIATIKSRDFFNELTAANPSIVPMLYAVKEYDHKKKIAIYDSAIYDQKNKIWKTAKPTQLQAHKIFVGSALSISKNDLTGYLSVSIEHLSPIFSYKLLINVIDKLNDIARVKDLSESEKALNFLFEQSSKTDLIGIAASINNLIEAQIQKQMSTQISKDYLVYYLDSPFIPELKSKPSRSTICILGFLFGFSLSILITLIREFIFNKERLK
jgi:capsular polysaccharide biosynthesis protein